MAEKIKMAYVDVLDDKGNVVKTLKYPEGGSVYEEIKRAQETGQGFYVYKPNKEGEEERISTSEANVDVQINPMTGQIVASGPKWLVDDVVNSETFKKNWSENNSLKQVVSLYKQDPTYALPDGNGGTISAADLLGQYQDTANTYAQVFPTIKNTKLTAKFMYGVDLDDTQVSEALTGYNKDLDYDKNGAVFIPEWALDNYDWKSLPSYNEENKTVSSEDFFRLAYSEGWNNDTASSLQKEAADMMKGIMDYNTFDKDDEEETNTRSAIMSDKSYAEEVARTMHMYNLVKGNMPEVDASYHAAMLITSTSRSMMAAIQNTGYNVSEAVTQVFGALNDTLDTEAFTKLNPIYYAAVLLGEVTRLVTMTSYAEGGSVKDGIFNYFDTLSEDLKTVGTGEYGYMLQGKHEEFTKAIEDMKAKNEKVFSWWGTGEFIGETIWWTAQQVALLNKIGGAVEGAFQTVGATEAFVSGLGKMGLSAKTTANLFKIAGKGTSIFTQSVLEFLMNDKQLVNKAFASGEITDELASKFRETMMWNTFGELAGPFSKWFFSNTVVGQATSMILAKPLALASYTKNSIAHQFFKALNKGAMTAAEAAKKGTPWEFTNTVLYKAKAGAAKDILVSPVFRSWSESEMTALNKKLSWTLLGKDTNMDVETLAGAARKIAEKTGIPADDVLKVLSDAVDNANVTAEDIVNSLGKSISEQAEDYSKQFNDALEEVSDGAKEAADASYGTVKGRINKNYERYRKLTLVRANLENNIDAINKGVSIKMSEINNFAANESRAYETSLRNVKTIESQLIESGAKLTDGGQGFWLSQESSDALSYMSQLGRAQYILENGGLTGKELAEVSAFVESVEAKLGELRGALGDDLYSALESHLNVISAYDARISDYMIKNGYVDKEYSSLIENLRNNKGWGENGERYIPTMRMLSGDDYAKKSQEFLNDLESGKIFRTKTVGDGVYRYQFVDGEHFLDPTTVVQMKLHGAATVAQAADLGRSIMGAAIPIRGVSSFNTDGIAKSDVNLVSKNVKQMQKDITTLLTKKEGASFRSKIREAVGRTTTMQEGIRARADYASAGAKFSRAADEARQAERKYTKFISSRTEFNSADVRTAGYGGIRNARTVHGILTQASGEELDTILATSKRTLPVLDPKNLSAKEFGEWWNNLEYIYGKSKGAHADGKKLKAQLEKLLDGRKANVTNIRRVFKESPELLNDIKSTYIIYGDFDMRKSGAYKTLIDNRLSATLSADERGILQRTLSDYQDAVAKRDALAAKAEDMGLKREADWGTKEAYGEEFIASTKDATEEIVGEAVAQLKGNAGFEEAVAYMRSLGVPDEVARRYLALAQLKSVKSSFFANALKESSNGSSAAGRAINNAVYNEEARISGAGLLKDRNSAANKIADAFGGAVKDEIESAHNVLETEIRMKYGSDAIDIDGHFESVEKETAEIKKLGFRATGKEGEIDFDRKRFVQLVNPQTKELKFYELDPLYADLVNSASPSFFYNQGKNDGVFKRAVLKFNETFSRIFRFGTTGIDKTSYVNQWFRDSQNAILVGGAIPFADFGPKTTRGLFNNIRKDFGIANFGKNFSQGVTDELVEATFGSSEAGLRALYGQDWLDSFRAAMVGGKTGEAAEAAYRRAVVEFTVTDTGSSALPMLGGMTQVELYNPKSGKTVTVNDLRKQYFESLHIDPNKVVSDETTMGFMKGMADKFADFADGFAKGSWRENFLRQSVYTTQYRAAIDAGMTMQEAKIWAQRYALDATTDFGRTFAYANGFIKSVPYLSAGLNGTRSFMRLLELDPAGVSSRITFGLICPYMALLSESLSDEKSFEMYKNIPEYEKEDNLVFIYNGSKVSIPIPQELAGFFAPFRHVVEKMAGANDHSIAMLAASDVLGIMPLDLSGFVNLDANTLMGSGEEFSLSRGVEKAVASLMPPVVKSAYMWTTGRDPYTGREIDRSYRTTDADGNPIIMDNTQSELANLMHKIFPNLSASAAYQVARAAIGRSTVSFVDELLSLFVDVKSMSDSEGSKYFKNQNFLDRMFSDAAEGYTGAITGEIYNKGVNDWKAAQNEMFEAKDELKVNEDLQKALTILRNSNSSETQKQNALRTYESITSDYRHQIYEIAMNYKQKYPEQYTSKHLATIVSLLTLPTDGAYRETAYNSQLSSEAYYEAKNDAVATLLRMGFPTDHTDITELGVGTYNKQGEYEFKIFTPYQINNLNNIVYNADEQINATVEDVISKSGIKTQEMWDGYYKAKDKGKSALKQYKSAWNSKVLTTLYPISQMYGADAFVNSKSTQNLLKNYLFIDNQYKAKQYLKSVFGGDK